MFLNGSPALKPSLQEIKERFLHHVRDLVSFERGSDQHHGSHGRHYVVRRARLLLLEERLPFLLVGGEGACAAAPASGVRILTYSIELVREYPRYILCVLPFIIQLNTDIQTTPENF